MENSYSETNTNSSKETARPGPQNQFGANQMMRPSASSDQLIAHSNSSQNLQHKQGFDGYWVQSSSPVGTAQISGTLYL